MIPRQLFGSKLGLVINSAGKDKIRYVIIYKVRPVKEMLVRYGVTHIANAKEYITQKDNIIIIKIDHGIFGLDSSGMLRMGEFCKLDAPKNLMFDGFNGIELLDRSKYRMWKPNFEQGTWEINKSLMVNRPKGMADDIYYAASLHLVRPNITDIEVNQCIKSAFGHELAENNIKLARVAARDIKELKFSYYPFKEALLPMPSELLHYEGKILISASEAVEWMRKWVLRMKNDKMQVIEDNSILADEMARKAESK